MRHFLNFVVRKLVEHPDDVDIYETEEGDTLTYKVSLHPDDVGKVVGKHGRTIGAIRNLLNAAASKNESRVIVEIVETAV